MLTILNGDALEQLKLLPSESVQCCVTSPPFWGLRDYGTARWEGGSAECDHKQGRDGCGRADGIVDERGQRNRDGVGSMGGDCQKCGAKRIDSQLGLERTPEEYVAKLVEVFREVRRVLRKDGTLWLNLGDSYAHSQPGRNRNGTGGQIVRPYGDESLGRVQGGDSSKRHGLKDKDLIGIPWRVAFALQADGWWLRSDIIWAKPNPMPESVTDRPTKSHEYLFLLTKSAKYFYDYQAILEPAAYDGRMDTMMKGSPKYADGYMPNQSAQTVSARGHERWPSKLPDTYKGSLPGRKDGPGQDRRGLGERIAYVQKGDNYGPNGQAFNQMHAKDGVPARNKRSVWTVATAPYPEAHFATYPPDLIKPCILAGTSAKGCCAKCGSPWERVVETNNPSLQAADSDIRGFNNDGRTSNPQSSKSLHRNKGGVYSTAETLGWLPTCRCRKGEVWHGLNINFSTAPCTVLDPFAGSGTTGAVALELGRKAILIELNPKYVELIRQRCDVTPGLALA